MGCFDHVDYHDHDLYMNLQRWLNSYCAEHSVLALRMLHTEADDYILCSSESRRLMCLTINL